MRSLITSLFLYLSSACAATNGPATAPVPAVSTVDGIKLQPMATLPKVSPASQEDTRISITNESAEMVLWDWVGFDGKLVRYATLAPLESIEQPTYVRHVWVITRGKERLGWFAAPSKTVNVTVR